MSAKKQQVRPPPGGGGGGRGQSGGGGRDRNSSNQPNHQTPRGNSRGAGGGGGGGGGGSRDKPPVSPRQPFHHQQQQQQHQQQQSHRGGQQSGHPASSFKTKASPRCPLQPVAPPPPQAPASQLRIQISQLATGLKCEGSGATGSKFLKDSALQLHPGALAGLGVREGALVLIRLEQPQLAPDYPGHFFARIWSWAKLEPHHARLQLLACGVPSSSSVSSSSVVSGSAAAAAGSPPSSRSPPPSPSAAGTASPSPPAASPTPASSSAAATAATPRSEPSTPKRFSDHYLVGGNPSPLAASPVKGFTFSAAATPSSPAAPDASSGSPGASAVGKPAPPAPGDASRLVGSRAVVYTLPQLMFPATRVVIGIAAPPPPPPQPPASASSASPSPSSSAEGSQHAAEPVSVAPAKPFWNQAARTHFGHCLRGRPLFRGQTLSFGLHSGQRQLLRVLEVEPTVPRPAANLPSLYRVGEHTQIELVFDAGSQPRQPGTAGDSDADADEEDTDADEDDADEDGDDSGLGQHPSAGSELQAVGGLRGEINRVCEHLRACLEQADRFGELGLAPPRGIILHGPPGTGKTMVARGVAGRFRARFLVVNGAEVVGRYLGESEQRLRRIFAEAQRRQPSIIFIDEVDAIAVDRSNDSGGSGGDAGQRRLLSCLTDCLDSLGGQGPDQRPARVAVLVATNRIEALDVSVRRPGRLDCELEIGIPGPEARVEILAKLLGVRLDSSHEGEVRGQGAAAPGIRVSAAELRALAGRTHGYVGADLKAVCQEAGLLAVREQQQRLRLQPARDRVRVPGQRVGEDSKALVVAGEATGASDGPGASGEAQITFPLLLAALGRVGPSAMREVALEVPQVGWDDVGGMQRVKESLREAVEWPLQCPELFVRMGIRPPKGILLYGPPGCSKTMLAKAIANECEHNFLAVRGPELFSKWVGDSEKALAQVFQRARLCSPAIIFFDEIDSIASARSQGGGGGGGGEAVSDRVLSQLLVELDGLRPLRSQVTVIAATNRPDVLDPALLRPGRIDRCVYVHPPDRESCLAILRLQLAKIPGLARDEATPEAVLELLEGHVGRLSGAEVVALCREACYRALERDAERVGIQDFRSAVAGLVPRLSPEQLRWYESFSLQDHNRKPPAAKQKQRQ